VGDSHDPRRYRERELRARLGDTEWAVMLRVA
jgi:hypothetical protein